VGRGGGLLVRRARERAHRIDPVGFAGVGTKFGTKLSPEDIVEEATWAISGLGAAQESNLHDDDDHRPRRLQGARRSFASPRGRLWPTERHRSRTCLASGYDAALVLKTNWGTGPSRSARELTDGWPSRNSSAHARLRRSQCPINNSRFDRLKPLSTAPARQWLSRDFRAGLWDQLLTATTGVVIRTTQQGKPRRCAPAR
jgi:hypothetical protein